MHNWPMTAKRQADIQMSHSKSNVPPGIWTFIVADCMGFAIFFLLFMTERMKDVTLFDESARFLNIGIGAVNTVILLTSSALVALAINALEQNNRQKAYRLLLTGLVVGSLFAVLKISEYYVKISAGITPTTNDFYTFYFILTGVHLLHYLIGLVVLIAMLMTLRAKNANNDTASWLESGALYWHLVDLLWLFLFPMLYLLPAQST